MHKVFDPPVSKPVLHSSVKFGGVPTAGLELTIEANRQEREQLAKLGQLEGLDKFIAVLDIKQSGRELRVIGTLKAEVVYKCVRTLEPFQSTLDEEIDLRFAPVRVRDEKHIDLSFGDDAPEPLIDGRADLGALVQEYFLLSLDRYPHNPSSDFVDDVTQDKVIPHKLQMPE